MATGSDLAGTMPRESSLRRRFFPVRFGRAAGLLLPTAGLLLWEILSRTSVLPANWMPAPTTIVRTLRDLLVSGDLLAHIASTLARVALGLLFGGSFGTIFGVASGQSSVVRKLVDPTLQALRNIPSMAWAPLFLLWMGIGEVSKVTLIAVGVFFPVYLNLYSGIVNIDPKLIEVGLLYRLSRMDFARRILLPAALPAYLVGLRSGLGLGWMFVVAAEIMGASRGLGYLMVDGQTTSRPELILAALLLFAGFGKLSDAGLESLGRHLLRWKSS